MAGAVVICDHCRKPCRVELVHEVEVSEVCGAREVLDVTYEVSDCCGADVVETTE